MMDKPGVVSAAIGLIWCALAFSIAASFIDVFSWGWNLWAWVIGSVLSVLFYVVLLHWLGAKKGWVRHLLVGAFAVSASRVMAILSAQGFERASIVLAFVSVLLEFIACFLLYTRETQSWLDEKDAKAGSDKTVPRSEKPQSEQTGDTRSSTTGYEETDELASKNLRDLEKLKQDGLIQEAYYLRMKQEWSGNKK